MRESFAEIGALADFINGAAFKPDDWNGSGRKIIRIQNLTDPCKPFNRTDRQVDAKYLVQPGDLLVSWSASLGVFEWNDPEAALLNQHIFRVLPKSASVDKRYLRHGLELALVDMQKHLHGATMQHVNRNEFLSTKIFAPPLPEQRRIAAILDQAEALRAKRRQAIEKLNGLTQAIFRAVFGETANAQQPLASLVQEFRYGTSNKSDGSGYPALRIPNVIGGGLDLDEMKNVPVNDAEFQRLQLRDGDILFVRTNGNPDFVGRSAVFNSQVVREAGFDPAQFIYASYLIRARLKQDLILPRVVQEYLSANEGRCALRTRCKTSAGQFNINTENLGAIPVPVPRLSLQAQFVSQITAVDKLKASHRASLAKLDALFASLQHRAFRGEL